MRDMATRKVKQQHSQPPVQQARQPHGRMPTSRAHKPQAAFQVYDVHLQMIASAAHQRGLSSATYLRRMVLPQVARDLGIECPEFASLEGAAQDPVALAAKAAGMSVREYEKAAARAAAEAAVRQQQQPSGFVSRGLMLPAGVVVRGRGK